MPTYRVLGDKILLGRVPSCALPCSAIDLILNGNAKCSTVRVSDACR